MSLKERASRPVSSAETTGTRVRRSPWRTRSVASRSASSGPKIERDSRIVSSSEIVKATITATTTAGPEVGQLRAVAVELDAGDDRAGQHVDRRQADEQPAAQRHAAAPGFEVVGQVQRHVGEHRPQQRLHREEAEQRAVEQRQQHRPRRSRTPPRSAGRARRSRTCRTGRSRAGSGRVRTRRAYVLGMNASARHASVVLARSRAPFSHASTGASSRRASSVELALSSATSSSATTSSTTKLRLLIGW